MRIMERSSADGCMCLCPWLTHGLYSVIEWNVNVLPLVVRF